MTAAEAKSKVLHSLGYETIDGFPAIIGKIEVACSEKRGAIVVDQISNDLKNILWALGYSTSSTLENGKVEIRWWQ